MLKNFVCSVFQNIMCVRINKFGPKFVLSETEENVFMDVLMLPAKWDCPLELHEISCMRLL